MLDPLCLQKCTAAEKMTTTNTEICKRMSKSKQKQKKEIPQFGHVSISKAEERRLSSDNSLQEYLAIYPKLPK